MFYDDQTIALRLNIIFFTVGRILRLFIANAYVKYALDGTLPDMSIGERCYWKPEFGSAEAWMEFCEAVVRFERGHDAKALCEAYSRL